jgi:hypothetical protein
LERGDELGDEGGVVGDCGAAEAAIDEGEGGEVALEIPEPDGGGTCEDDGVFGRGFGGVFGGDAFEF